MRFRLNRVHDSVRPPVALIDEERCIGCTLCLAVCPTDAIVGAAHMMHTVIARDCIGCELCLPPCPVDCIAMVERALPLDAANKRRLAERARWRRQRLARLAQNASMPRVEAKIIARALARARRRLKR